MRRIRTALLAFSIALAAPAAAQEPDTTAGWDAPRALELVEVARARRLLPSQDTALRNYTARAEGFVYFYLDRRDGSDRTLVKTDQVALELYWAQPNLTKQRIVGLRDESRLPNRMYYHLDHLTVVQNGFGDIIRMGDGDEVSDVPHPVAPGSGSVYEFRLVDSLTLQVQHSPEPLRVYELQVRPRRTDQPAMVGSIFVERGSGDVVRMSFTFTPASYVDRRLDHISVSLDNGLWEGRYWLPNEQTVLIRRQVPELDFAAGAVIQGRMRIRDYTFNDSIPRNTFFGRRVTAVPLEERRAYQFESGIYDDLNDAGLSLPGDLADIRTEAAQMLGRARLSGLPRWRLSLGSASSVLRYNRAEGVAIGAGVAYVPGPVWRADLQAGYAFGAEHVNTQLTLRRELGTSTEALLRLHLNQPHDIGLRPAVPPAINTLTSAFAADDFSDLYYASGARLLMRRQLGTMLQGEAELVMERHRSAARTETEAVFNDDAPFGGVLPTDAGRLAALSITLRRPLPDPLAQAWSGAARLELGTLDGGAYVRPVLEASWRRTSTDHARQLVIDGSVGALVGSAPSQRLFLLGGINTLPGYAHRAFVGERHALLNVEASAAVWNPWLRLRAVGAAGAVGGLPDVEADDPAAWSGWGRSGTGGIRTSVGAGVSLFWDLLRIDAVRGLNGGKWQVNVGFHREFWDIS